MQFPDITPQMVSILAHLMGGRAWRLKALLEAVHWPGHLHSFYGLVDGLCYDGLILKESVKVRGGGHPHVVVSITDEGRQAWQECVDFYLHVAKLGHAAAESPEPDRYAEAAIARKPVKPHGSRRRHGGRQRAPTVLEHRLILSHTKPAFARLYRTVRRVPALMTEVLAARIADFDLRTGTLHVGGRRFKLTGDARAAVESAIGARRSGLIFLNTQGRAWSLGAVYSEFHRVRLRAGLPKEVTIRGQRLREKQEG